MSDTWLLTDGTGDICRRRDGKIVPLPEPVLTYRLWAFKNNRRTVGMGSDERDTDARDKADQRQANEAIVRYAKYTAPAMLAVLGTAGFGAPVAAQTLPP